MVHFAVVVALMSPAGCVSDPPNPTTTASAILPACTLTAAEKLTNARLSFGDFDQLGTMPSTGRALSNRGCFAVAAEAQEDYLARAAFEDERSHTSAIFHLAQFLAMAGRRDEAAGVVLGARRVGAQADPAFDWNAYVVGTWAFLKGDKPLLQDRHARLKALPGHGNQTNATVLNGLIQCFEKPYLEAYTDACRAR